MIEKVIENLKGTPAEGVVSYADLIALGGAYAVSVTGGPVIDVPIGECLFCIAQRSFGFFQLAMIRLMWFLCMLTGRRDSAVADPTGRLPEETLSAEALRLTFAAMGMSSQELVALSGAHTVHTWL